MTSFRKGYKILATKPEYQGYTVEDSAGNVYEISAYGRCGIAPVYELYLRKPDGNIDDIIVSHNNGVATLGRFGKPVNAQISSVKKVLYADSEKRRTAENR